MTGGFNRTCPHQDRNQLFGWNIQDLIGQWISGSCRPSCVICELIVKLPDYPELQPHRPMPAERTTIRPCGRTSQRGLHASPPSLSARRWLLCRVTAAHSSHDWLAPINSIQSPRLNIDILSSNAAIETWPLPSCLWSNVLGNSNRNNFQPRH